MVVKAKNKPAINDVMKKTLAEIAELIGGKVIGDEKLKISGLKSLDEAREGDLTFLANSKYLAVAKKTKASAILTTKDIKLPGKSVIQTDNPSLAFTKIASLVFQNGLPPLKGVHPSAVLASNVKLAGKVALGAYVVIEGPTEIQEGTLIYPGCYIGPRVKIGSECLIYPNVTIREGSVIGNRVKIHSGTVIGSDGFGYEQIDGEHVKIPQHGIVEVQDDVEIGANVTIDRARFDKTLIGRGTKIDNLVQIAHNVNIGENCIVIAQVGISGSTKIGKNSILAGQAGVAGHLTIGEGSIIAAQSGVTKSLPPLSKVSGYPAKPHDTAKRVNAALQRLPHYVAKIKELETRVKELESFLKKNDS